MEGGREKLVCDMMSLEFVSPKVWDGVLLVIYCISVVSNVEGNLAPYYVSNKKYWSQLATRSESTSFIALASCWALANSSDLCLLLLHQI